MNPGDQLGVLVLTPADDPGRGAFQVGNFNVVVLFYAQPVQLLRRQELHELAVYRYLFGKHRMKVNVGRQKLLIDAAAEKNRDGDIKFRPVHVVDQVDQHLFGTPLAKVMD